MSIPKVSIRQIKAARALLGWSQADLAHASGISEPTLKRLEASNAEYLGGRPSTATAIQRALEDAGVMFLANGQNTSGGPGVRLRD